MGKAIHEFKILRNYLIHFSNVAFNLKSTNSSVHEHIQCHQTMKFCVHEIK